LNNICGPLDTAWGSICIELVANSIWTLLVIAFALLVATYKVISRRPRLRKLFKLKSNDEGVKVYISRHVYSSRPPEFDFHSLNSRGNLSRSQLKIKTVQEIEHERRERGDDTYNSRPLAMVSGIETIEYLRFHELVTYKAWFNKMPDEFLTWLFRFAPSLKPIQIQFDACPDNLETLSSFSSGTYIFIGGPRANHGTFYFWYGEELCKVRLGRLDNEKNIAYALDDSGRSWTVSANQNLGIVQRVSSGDRTIIYLAGSGVDGTAAAVEFFMMNWKDMQKKSKEQDFVYIVSCSARLGVETLSYYVGKKWNKAEIHKLYENFSLTSNQNGS